MGVLSSCSCCLQLKGTDVDVIAYEPSSSKPPGPSDHNEAVIAVIGLEGIVRSAFRKHDRIKFFPCAEECGFWGTTIVTLVMVGECGTQPDGNKRAASNEPLLDWRPSV